MSRRAERRIEQQLLAEELRDNRERLLATVNAPPLGSASSAAASETPPAPSAPPPPIPIKRGPGRPRKNPLPPGTLPAPIPIPPRPEALTSATSKEAMSTPETTPAPTGKSRKVTVYSEPPVEQMGDIIAQQFYPEVWAEVRRLLPGGGTAIIRRGIRFPITHWQSVAERISVLLAGGGTFLVYLAGEKNGVHFIAWKENFEGPPRQVPPGVTLAFDMEREDWVLGTVGGAEMGLPAGGMGAPPAITGVGGNVWAGALPPPMPMPGAPGGAGGMLSPVGAPPFPAPIRDAYGRLLPPPQSLLDQWMLRYPVETQWNLARDKYQHTHQIQLPPVDGSAATAVAMQWNAREAQDVASARTQAARYEEKLDAARDRNASILDSERAARMNLERQIAELRAEAREREARVAAEKQTLELRQQMEMLKLQIGASKSDNGHASGSSADMVKAIAPLAGALAPVVGAYLTSQAQMQQQAQQQQMMFMQTMMQSSMNRPSGLAEFTPMLAALTPLAAPMLQQWMANQDPEKLDEAKHNQDQRNLMMLKFMFDMMQAQMPGGEEPEPMWFKMLKEVGPALMGIGQEVFQAMMKAPQPQMPSLPPTPRHHMPPPAPGETQVIPSSDQVQAQPAPVAPPPAATYALDIAGTVRRFAQIDQNAAEILGFILAQLAKTPGAEPFLTHEWAAILFHIHAQHAADEVAFLLVDHLEHSRTFALLPEVLLDVFTKPAETLKQILEPLPIFSLAPTYAQQVLSLCIEEIQEREKDRLAVEAGELEEAEMGGDEEAAASDDDDVRRVNADITAANEGVVEAVAS